MQTRDPATDAGYTERIAFVVELAEHLHAYGTTAQRLEGAIESVAKRLGLECEPWVNPTGMILAFSDHARPAGESDTTRVIRVGLGDTDLYKLCEVDRIAEDVMAGRVQIAAGREALRALDLESLAGRPITEIFVGLADYICPGAGTVDEGIAREAYIETVVELASEGLTDLTTFTPDQMQTVFELYATHAIEARICNDIGTKAVTMPADAQAAHRVEQQLRDFIRGGVSDALTRARAESPNLTPERIQTFVDTVYESAFAILQTLGDAEANQ